MTRAALGSSGAVLGLIGGALLIAPGAFLEMSHVVVERDPSVLSEVSASSGVSLITSALMILGAVRLRFADLALSLGGIVYGSYGVTRLLGMALHGVPSESIIAAMAIELVIAAWLIFLRLASPCDIRAFSLIGLEAQSRGV